MPTTSPQRRRVACLRGKSAAAGNRVGVVEACGEWKTWTYDAAYQLTRERRSGVASYDVTHTYDPAGNRTLKIDSGARTTAAYDAGNRLRYRQDGSGRTTFVFDASGNQIKQNDPAGQITTGTWNYENRSTVIRQPAGTRVTFTYNGDQVRFQKQTAAGTWKYVYDGENRLVETDGSNAAQSVYTIEPLTNGNLVSQRQLVGGVWSQIYYHFDALGSTYGVTDSYAYVAFGELKTSHAPGPWAFEPGLRNTLLRMWQLGRRDPFKSFIEIPASARGAFVKVRGIGPVRMWKRLGGQHFTKMPGSLDLSTGRILTPSHENIGRFRGDVVVCYVIDGTVDGVTVAIIYWYSKVHLDAQEYGAIK